MDAFHCPLPTQPAFPLFCDDVINCAPLRRLRFQLEDVPGNSCFLLAHYFIAAFATTIMLRSRKKQNRALLDVPLEEDLEKARQALKKGANPSAQSSSWGLTPLYWASRCGCKGIVSPLLEKGANPNAQNKDGWAPLHGASANGHEATASLLLKKGANINAQSKLGGMPLHCASRNGHKAATSLLLENGTIVNVQGARRGVPLRAASFNGRGAVALLLLENDANPGAQNNNESMPLHWASHEGELSRARVDVDLHTVVRSRASLQPAPCK